MGSGSIYSDSQIAISGQRQMSDVENTRAQLAFRYGNGHGIISRNKEPVRNNSPRAYSQSTNQPVAFETTRGHAQDIYQGRHDYLFNADLSGFTSGQAYSDGRLVWNGNQFSDSDRAHSQFYDYRHTGRGYNPPVSQRMLASQSQKQASGYFQNEYTSTQLNHRQWLPGTANVSDRRPLDEKKLLIFDMNKVLMRRRAYPNLQSYILRPHVHSFLQEMNMHFQLAVWTSMTRRRGKPIVDSLFRDLGISLLFVWFQEKCSPEFLPAPSGDSAQRQTSRGAGKEHLPLLTKNLEQVWYEYPSFNRFNTVSSKRHFLVEHCCFGKVRRVSDPLRKSLK